MLLPIIKQKRYQLTEYFQNCLKKSVNFQIKINDFDKFYSFFFFKQKTAHAFLHALLLFFFGDF
ncbi:hypothetical protein D920_00488 [Enterococcus faecalis 13-SD-W-01]|nr:hypothetical protein D920_00488 [Enterococcus faecalis 13-SD-W-01]